MYLEIKTERLLLRPLCPEDLETTHAYASDPENGRYMYHVPNETIEETANFLSCVVAEWAKDQPKDYSFAIVLDGSHIGAVSLSLIDDGTCGNMGWILNRQYHGHGYATEAASALVKFARDELHLPRLIAHCDQRNNASYRVMEKLGMTLADDTGIRHYPKTGETAKEFLYTLELR